MADNEILPASCTWVFPTMGIMQFNKNATDRAKEDIKAALKTLNDHLLTRTFLVGERVTLADIAVACTLLNLYKQVLDPSFRKRFLNVTRWFTTVINQPNAKEVIGPSHCVPRWLNLMPRSLLSFQARELGTRKVRRKILRMPYQRELSIWRNGKGFTPTMTRILPLPGSGSTLTTRTTQSGEATTSTMTS